ncbi:insulinase family protein [Lutimaribacter sp. EGI FJ00015]|uniref:Insulinase family protein n=2 Tax=Lutimaribacter degradans TaxID=2945989 RepID=A0ACC5ZYI9_9RHOB|nr:pitrilysin family protein [Lutimaribacter sp. EGI FJ00013]MCM2563422.1 insulinase family protein [Lutimaribacter sp. EGI FJ00013]MCO0614500.1 insulinase family protein [Lutimaribacter sp. EGI FJ00015]MCO0637173.1 insulinase family protein [Lutimaribacter sp. EGI FJ00014]
MRFVWATLLLVLALPARADVEIQEITTPGGINAWLVEERSIPFTALEIRFRGGASLDSADKQGATGLMVSLLEEGAGDLDARAFARETESLAASFNYRLASDAVRISARFLSENRDQAVQLLRDSLIRPRFDDDAIERVRAQLLSSLRSDLKDPRAIAAKRFAAMVHGNHPYARPQDGTIETVTALTRDDIVAAHQGALARDRVYVGAVGDIGPDELSALLDDLLGELPETGAPLPGPAPVSLDGGTHVVTFDTPQSVAVFGQPGINRDDPDFFALFVLDHILGGGSFESRLMQEVREKRGLTYGVYSYLVDKDQAQLWQGSVASANDRVAQAVQVIRDEWKKLRDGGVTAEELQDAKTYLTGAYPLRFDGNGPIANIIVAMQMEGLPVDYIATRNDKVNDVTLEQVNRVAAERLDPDRLTFVVVGQPEGLDQTAD